MQTTLIDTEALLRDGLPGAGDFTVILSEQLCGAKNVTGYLRWLRSGDELSVGADPDAHQLVYLMEGRGTLVLEGQRYDVDTGAGVYLGAGESVEVGHRGNDTLKLLHLVVPSSVDTA